MHPSRYVASRAHRPGTVTAVRGIAFQSDGRSTIGAIFIRPLEALDRWIVGIQPRPGAPSLAMHAGLRIQIDGRHDYVAEQLLGTWDLAFKSGLNWTPYEAFKQRDRGGWDVTVPLTEFRAIDDTIVEQTARRLNTITGHPFVGEDCTAFIERACGGRRLFADSPLLRLFGLGARIGDPAMPLLRAEARIDERARRLLQVEVLQRLPDPRADAHSPNARVWIVRSIPLVIAAWLLGRRLGGAGGTGAISGDALLSRRWLTADAARAPSRSTVSRRPRLPFSRSARSP
jgi:hypothetical protein